MPNYKDTLNLPRTDFPMRAGLTQNEPLTRDRWQAEGIYGRIQELSADRPRFTFHDGPPYANGPIHLGHLLNKSLKDFVVRSRLTLGESCPYIPGWDCHGLPIEHRVLGELAKSGETKRLQALPDGERRIAVRGVCAESAKHFIGVQIDAMRSLLTLADYEHPYITMDPSYEREVLHVFAEMVADGLVFRALKPVHWSIANRTALAEAELEYEDREDISVYVDLECVDRDAVATAFGCELDQTPTLMIWTTTPWTLPANLAVAVNPQHRYALVAVDGNVTVLASELVAKVTALAKSEAVEVLAEADGSTLVGLEYRHPFCERTGRVVAAEYVTFEDGTGLVHTAPGHGDEDYRTGLREGLETYCPVREDGTYDDTVPEWLRGMSVWDANQRITDHLRESGHLFHDQRFMHSYPHDARSGTPTIFRSTEQWFVGVDRPTRHASRSLRELAVQSVSHDVKFVPEWGRNRMRGMLESRPDWCISRQRSWGLPIPAFRAADGAILLTPASVRAVAEVFGVRGSDAWFSDDPATLLAAYDSSKDPDAPAGIDVARLEKLHDIFDVWFESGSSWAAVMRARGHEVPVDLYLEGSDQHRGWFQLSLLPALAVTGKPPFRTIVTHGFIVDRDGRKMSKSKGNALAVDTLLKEFGADVCRWWASSLSYENDIKADKELFALAGESYRKVRNTLRFLLSNLDDLPIEGVDSDGPTLDGIDPTSLDAWILAEASRVQATVLEGYRAYDFRRAHQALFDFCNESLSATWCSAVKDRLYCDRADAPRRRRAQAVAWRLAEMLCRLLAPILAHTADEAHRALWRDDSRSVHGLPAVAMEFTADPAWAAVFAMREHALKALEAAKASGIENRLDAELTIVDGEGTLSRFVADIPDLLGVSRVRFVASADVPVAVGDLRAEPKCERSWRRDGTVRSRSDGGMLSDRDAEAIGVS